MIDKTDLNTLIANKYYNRTATHSVNDNWAEALRVAEEIKQLFVEQACEAIEPLKKTSCDSAGYISDPVQIMNNYYEKAQQAIRDKFK